MLVWNNQWFVKKEREIWACLQLAHIFQVALERVKEYSELKREPPEFIEPRPPASWPSHGAIKCEDLVIRYAVSECSEFLVLVCTWPFCNSPIYLTFSIISISRLIQVKRWVSEWRRSSVWSWCDVGWHPRTHGFWKEHSCPFVFPLCGANGRLHTDWRSWHEQNWLDRSPKSPNYHTSCVSLDHIRMIDTPMRSLEDPTVLSGTLRSTLDVFGEYDDADIVSSWELFSIFEK